MKSHKGNKKKSNNRTKKYKHSAKLIKLDDKGTTLLVLKKNTPKSVLKKLFKDINKNDYIDLCKEMTFIKKATRKKATRKHSINIKKTGIRRRYVGKGGGSIGGPIGSFITGGTFIKMFLGNELFFLLGGASLASILYAFKKVKLMPELIKDRDVDYLNVKLMKSLNKSCSFDIDDDKSRYGIVPEIDPKDLDNCYANNPIIGTSPSRKAEWNEKIKKDMEAEEKRVTDLKAGLLRAQQETTIIT